LLLVGWYNQMRFGSPLETGRSVDAALAARFGYGQAAALWPGLHGFLSGSGKSLFVFVPAALGGLLLWPSFVRVHRALGWALGLAVIARVLFVAGRTDWHGGFCLGPRLLLPAVPLLLLPIVPWLDRALGQRRLAEVWTFAVLSWACVAQQLVFVLGEPFTFYRRILEIYLPRGVNVFEGNRLYVDWAFNPLLNLLHGPRGPWLLRQVPLSNAALWAALTALAAILWALAAWQMSRNPKARTEA
jgi:hypothetical protein